MRDETEIFTTTYHHHLREYVREGQFPPLLLLETSRICASEALWTAHGGPIKTLCCFLL